MINAYMQKFTEDCERLAQLKIEECPPVEVRNKQVEEMIEHYYQFVGKMPKSYELDLLGSYILVKDLKNKDVDKVTNTEYPILSNNQTKRRNKKQLLLEESTIDFLNTKRNKHVDGLAKKAHKKAEY